MVNILEKSGSFIGLTQAMIHAFSDCIACRRDDSSHICWTANGKAEIDTESIVRKKFFIFTEKRQNNTGKIFLSGNVSVNFNLLEEIFPEAISHQETICYNDLTQRVEKHWTETFFSVVIEDKIIKDEDFLKQSGKVLADKIIKSNFELPTWDNNVKTWINRTRFLAESFPEQKLISYDFNDYQCIIEEFCMGENSYQKIKNQPIVNFVKNVMSWEDQQFVETNAPEKIDLPNGKKIRIKYRPGGKPLGSAKIQELFGINENPKICKGKISITLEILAPNMRPIQITDDIASFWKNLYPSLKPQLSRRYPKHRWI